MGNPQISPFILFPLFFIAVWLVVSFALSKIGGWSALAERFRFDGQFYGAQWNWQAAQMRNTANYNGCLIIGCNEVGLYLWTMPPFRFRHPPLLIPWTEITVSRTRILFRNFVRLSLGRDLQIPFSIRESAADKIRNAAGVHWPVAQSEPNRF